MNLRQLKKQDKKAMAILIGVNGYSREHFALNDEGTRIDFWWRCSYEYDEWDCVTAYEHWLEQRGYQHPNMSAGGASILRTATPFLRKSARVDWGTASG